MIIVPETVVRLSISGMACAGCVATVENALKGLPGVSAASVNFAEHTARVTGDAPSAALIAAVRQAGYEAAELRGAEDEQEKEAAERRHYRALLRKFIVAALVGAPLFVAEPLGWLPMLDTPGGRLFWLVIGVATLFVLIYSGGHFFRGAWKALRAHNANMDTHCARYRRGLVVFHPGGDCSRARAQSRAPRLFRGGGDHYRAHRPRSRW